LTPRVDTPRHNDDFQERRERAGLRLDPRDHKRFAAVAGPNEGWAEQVYGAGDVGALWARSRVRYASTSLILSQPGMSIWPSSAGEQRL